MTSNAKTFTVQPMPVRSVMKFTVRSYRGKDLYSTNPIKDEIYLGLYRAQLLSEGYTEVPFVPPEPVVPSWYGEENIHNAETVKAMEELKDGKGKTFKSTKEFYKDLGIDEDLAG